MTRLDDRGGRLEATGPWELSLAEFEAVRLEGLSSGELEMAELDVLAVGGPSMEGLGVLKSNGLAAAIGLGHLAAGPSDGNGRFDVVRPGLLTVRAGLEATGLDLATTKLERSRFDGLEAAKERGESNGRLASAML